MSVKQRKSSEHSSLQLNLVVKSGKYTLGINQAIKTIRDGQAKLVLLSNNLPPLVSSQIEYMCAIGGTTVKNFASSSKELGIALGKKYNVGVMSIIDPGDADLKYFE